MKGFTVSSVAFALVLAAACGDDDDSTKTEAKCKTPYPDYTATTLKAATKTAGKCAADTATVCANDMFATVSGCGVDCYSMNMADPTKVPACTATCIQKAAAPTPSTDCTNCYVADVVCALTNCLATCAAGKSAACDTCRADAGCTEAFYSCSGLPEPTGSGAGGAGGATGTGGTTGKGGTTSKGGTTATAGDTGTGGDTASTTGGAGGAK
ncbi:MAG: hypothetical protein QM756_00285 [Polyangiaceae bacterium]